MRTPWFLLPVVALAYLLASCAAPESVSPEALTETTTVIVVRHAEKASDHPSDPSLSEAGHARAEALRDALSNAGVSAIHVTQYRRTRDTAAPLAVSMGLPLTTLPVESGDVADHVQALQEAIMSEHAGEVVLVVGHSNTVPEIVSALSGREVPAMSEAVYDRIYVVTVGPDNNRDLIELRYGEPAS